MSLDYATLARIEDHLRRIADALEGEPRKAFRTVREAFDWLTVDARDLETGEPVPVVVTVKRVGCGGDRACTDRSHWAPPKSAEEIRAFLSEREQDRARWEVRPVVAQCPATMPGHWCTRREHADDRHVWAMSDAEAERHLRQEDWFADPLDEDDHRPRHFGKHRHITRSACGRWHSDARTGPDCEGGKRHFDQACTLAWWASYDPLTFCDCGDAATIEAENGATD